MRPIVKRNAVACLIATLIGFSPALAQTNGCPVRPGKILTAAEIYDGPVEDNAILAPDSSTGTAAKAVNRFDVGAIVAQGRKIVLSCHYKGEAKPVYIEIRTKVTTCEQRVDKVAGGSLDCR